MLEILGGGPQLPCLFAFERIEPTAEVSRPSTSVWLVKALLKTWKWLLRRALQRQARGLPFHRVAAVSGKLGHTQG